MDLETTEAVAAMLAADPAEAPCPWHAFPLSRRTRFKLSLAVSCPACRASTQEYCRSHTGLPLHAKVHHDRAQLAERTACTCSSVMRSR